MIRIKIVAPAIAVRAGLRALLSEDPQIDIRSEASSIGELAEANEDADVMVWSPGAIINQGALQSELAILNGSESTAVLVIYDDPELIEQLAQLRVRAWGLVSTESTQAELVTAVQALNEGLSVTNPAWIRRMIKTPTAMLNVKDEMIEELTGRELEILQLLALGLTNKQIAAKLRISAHTVKFHVSAIFNKLGTNNRMEAVNLGLKRGLIVL